MPSDLSLWSDGKSKIIARSLSYRAGSIVMLDCVLRGYSRSKIIGVG